MPRSPASRRGRPSPGCPRGDRRARSCGPAEDGAALLTGWLAVCAVLRVRQLHTEDRADALPFLLGPHGRRGGLPASPFPRADRCQLVATPPRFLEKSARGRYTGSRCATGGDFCEGCYGSVALGIEEDVGLMRLPTAVTAVGPDAPTAAVLSLLKRPIPVSSSQAEGACSRIRLWRDRGSAIEGSAVIEGRIAVISPYLGNGTHRDGEAI